VQNTPPIPSPPSPLPPPYSRQTAVLPSLFFLYLFWKRMPGISGKIFYMQHAIPNTQPTMSKHWKKLRKSHRHFKAAAKLLSYFHSIPSPFPVAKRPFHKPAVSSRSELCGWEANRSRCSFILSHRNSSGGKGLPGPRQNCRISLNMSCLIKMCGGSRRPVQLNYGSKPLAANDAKASFKNRPNGSVCADVHNIPQKPCPTTWILY